MAKGRGDYDYIVWVVGTAALVVLTIVLIIVGGALLGVGIRDSGLGLTIAGGIILGLTIFSCGGAIACCRKIK